MIDISFCMPILSWAPVMGLQLPGEKLHTSQASNSGSSSDRHGCNIGTAYDSLSDGVGDEAVALMAETSLKFGTSRGLRNVYVA